MDKINIRELQLATIIGVHPWERQKKQLLLVDLTLELDLSAAANSDDLEQTIDYDALCQKLTAAVADTDFLLIEALSGFICRYIFEHYQTINNVHLILTKKVAVANAACIQIEMNKSRKMCL